VGVSRTAAARLGGGLVAGLLALTACGGGANSSSGGTVANATTGSPASTGSTGSTSVTPPPTSGSPTGSAAAGARFGSGCGQVPADLSSQSLAAAVTKVPDLARLQVVLQAANLASVIDQSGDVTLFAPTDAALATVPPAQLQALTADKNQLTRVLTYHVVPRRLGTADLTGAVKTLEGANLTVTGTPPAVSLGPTGTEAHVTCGNITVANGKLYLIDAVLNPPS
jgi:uncharacterized surface protein with fasciclin (FAS1) repeats